ncbi:hypothetical protein CASFOL_030997 [Castilleja foliolosa]|uniref:HSF-type DNA-binding domain-containing protein n=1 Tax=Castilleja foliolosa TaxID=1961234 RepID=A0ABD3C6W4_9LAMI
MECVWKGSAAPFLVKTYMMVDDPATDDVVSWNADGTAFVVWQPAEFARDLLPTVFKHSNFSSFVRQLNTGFHKVTTNRWEFSNNLFIRGKRDQLRDICRKKATSNKPQPKVQLPNASPEDQSGDNEERPSPSASSSSSDYTNLVGENKRLRRENGALSSELAVMKKKFDELLDLAAVNGGGNSEREESDDEGPKLFGVRLRRLVNR